MIRKVYANQEEFHKQNAELGTKLPFAEDTAVLASPLQVGKKTIPNRLVCQAMEGCDGTPTGEPDTLTKRRYDRFAKGGFHLQVNVTSAELLRHAQQCPEEHEDLLIRISGYSDYFTRLDTQLQDALIART